MVVDLRKVNALLKPIITLLPKIDELMQQITALKPSHLTSFDFLKGYYQCPISKRSQPVTAIVSPKTGISYCHVTLPMGLAASPAAFIQMMSRVFKDKTRWYFLFCYVDDLFLVSSSFSEHLRHLKEVLHNLLINKTSIAYPEIEYLGYIVNQHGIRISESKIKAIKAIQPPKTKKSLQRILGLLQYFRKHIPNFSKKTANMTQLLRNVSSFGRISVLQNWRSSDLQPHYETVATKSSSLSNSGRRNGWNR